MIVVAITPSGTGLEEMQLSRFYPLAPAQHAPATSRDGGSGSGSQIGAGMSSTII
jgi:hypothetical protein